jgi:hypothetical protein
VDTIIPICPHTNPCRAKSQHNEGEELKAKKREKKRKPSDFQGRTLTLSRHRSAGDMPDRFPPESSRVCIQMGSRMAGTSLHGQSATVETANRWKVFISGTGRGRFNKDTHRGQVAVMALIGVCVLVCTSTVPSAVRWFEALPSRQFGPALSSTRERVVGLQIIEVTTDQGSNSAVPTSADIV